MARVQKFNTEELCGRLDERRGFNMNTISGGPVWPADPRPEDIRIDDITGALSRICRYNGHLREGDWCVEPKFADHLSPYRRRRRVHNGAGTPLNTIEYWLPFEIYSVAQHSVLVEQYVRARFAPGDTYPPKLFLAALLHDAHEYVLGDMVKPQKLMYKERKRYEMEWDDRIAERFGFSADLFYHPAIKEADYRIFLTEKRDLVISGTTDFGVAKAEPYPGRIIPVLPSAARKMFVDRFNELYKGE